MWRYNYSSEFYHHGVLGMKWGVRRTSEKSGYNALSKQKPKKSNHRLKLEEKYKSKGMSNEEAEKAAARRIKAEKFIAAAAAITVVAATVYVARNHHLKIKAEELSKTVKSWSDLSTIKHERTMWEDAIDTNPNFKILGSNLYKRNCPNCTAAYELRRRGFDVEALGNKKGMILDKYFGIFKNMERYEIVKSPGDGVKEVTSAISEVTKEWGEGARGVVSVTNNKIGHVFSMEIRGGKLEFIDPQLYTSRSEEMFTTAKTIMFGRVDNLELSDEILSLVKKRG